MKNTERINIRVSKKNKKIIEQAAEEIGLSLTGFMVMHSLKKAKELIKDLEK